ncbi:MAG: pyruvate, phosphate dikinase [Treponema sp.]|nr:pyruvate, phosphate dikinase [Treponema sp.]
MAKTKNVFFFGNKKADGNAAMKHVLGGKGANLAEMANLGMPVPPGFTISTEVCAAYYANGRSYSDAVRKDVHESLAKLEKTMKKKLGDPDDPLLVSVRSGAAASMPGMMDTILNLGMNDGAVLGLAQKTGKDRFAWDSYRRFIQMYGDVVMGVNDQLFEGALHGLKENRGVKLDTDLGAEDLKELVGKYKKIIKEETGTEFPQDPHQQLWGAIDAVFGSWMNERAIKYRKHENIRGLKGTAVNVQSMVFGNFGEDSGTGVCFSRDPSTGENVFYGEYLMNAQGEDVVAGIRTPEKLSSLKKENPAIYAELVGYKNKLEKHFRDMQDIEFTVERGKLFILQARNGKRSGMAAIKTALDMVAEGLIDKNMAIMRVTAGHLDQLLHPMIDPKEKKDAVELTRGLNASPGAATGRIVFSAKDAEEWKAGGEQVLLVRKETSPEDIGGMVAAEGILTSTGGMTSHAAVVARGMGTPCVAGAGEVSVVEGGVRIKDKHLSQGDWLTIDGSTGAVYEGKLNLVPPNVSKEMEIFLSWCDSTRKKAVRGKLKGFGIRTNADTPEDAKRAFDFGAEGIGLCRTEHMFFDEEKLPYFRAMIIAGDKEARLAALKDLLPLQEKDFYGIFKAMEGRPVVIRLLDPPLHEFVPHTDAEIDELAKRVGVSFDRLKAKVESLKEFNPMLGHRGCRLAITYPEIYDMQVEAIARAAVQCMKEDFPVSPEIMIPLVFGSKELDILRPNAEKILERVFAAAGVKLPVKIGTMIEIPRAAVCSDEIAPMADFFSFGTNDLTQMTFGISRDDINTFLPDYLSQGIFEVDPFQSVDKSGVGALMKLAIDQGREVKPGLSIGVCGEHGGDPATIDFCYRSGLSYVSCSPFRVPLARLASAQAVIGYEEETGTKKSASGRKSGAKKTAADKKPAGRKAAVGRKPAKDAATGKKSAGRPKKAAADKKPAAKKSAVKSAAPKKEPGKRGRPSKVAAEGKMTTPKKEPGKRGRPSKAVAEQKVTATKKTPAPKKVAKEKKPTATARKESAPGEKKSRGRPRKVKEE